MTTQVEIPQIDHSVYRGILTYDTWMESLRLPIHRGYYIEDLRTVEVGMWKDRETKTAFVQLEGMQGVCEARVSEIDPGQTVPAHKVGVDEMVYVLSGNGITTFWADEKNKKNFEWGPRSLFVAPRHQWRQYSNTRGTSPVRLLHFSYLPIAMSGSNNANFFFNNPYTEPVKPAAEAFSEAKVHRMNGEHDDPFLWIGNFFPDLAAWDKLQQYQNRGAGGHHLQIKIPDTEMSAHMSVFDARRYKKGHRHGPGRGIVIPAGEGYSIMWPEGKEKIVIPWHEGSVFVPPARWFHQHFNVSAGSDRYLALHSPRVIGALFGSGEAIEDRARDQIEYPDEDPWIREKFESELAKRGLTSVMVDEAYKDRNYQWKTMDE